MILLKDRSFPGIVRSSKKQGHCKPIIFLLTILLTLLLASCKNPWMEDILDPLLNPTVTFNANGGTPVASIKIQRGSAIETPPATEREGFYFNGWHTSWALNDPVAFPYTVNEKITLYASWTTSVPAPSLDGISANYTGTEVIYPNTPLDSLKNHLTVTAHYSDGENETLSGTAYELSGALTVGTDIPITVTYGEKQTTFYITVTAPLAVLTHITANYTGTAAIYPITPLDSLKDDLTVTAHLTDETEELIGAPDYELSGTLTVGTSTITVTYGGQQTTFDVTVTAITLDRISASYVQTVTIYPTMPLDDLKTGLTVTAYYSNGASDTLDGAAYGLGGTLKVGPSTITVTYDGKQTTFDVTVAAVTFDRISASYTGTATIYTTTPVDSLKDNLTVTAHYSDGTSDTLGSAAYGLDGTLAVGTSTITVKYGEKQTTFDVTVAAVTLDRISANYTGTATIYPTTPVDSLKDNLTVTVHYSDGTSNTLGGAAYGLNGTLNVGTSTITVTYGGKQTTFDVTVTATITLDSISASYTGTAAIYPTTPLNDLKAGLTVTAHYSNGASETLGGAAYGLNGTLDVGTRTITVTYGGKQTTFTVTVTAVTLSSISADYTGPATIYTTTPLDSLKDNLIVTAHHSDGESETLNNADYELDGTLTVGVNIPITVKYGGRETTFTVTVTSCSHNYTWETTTPLTAGIGVETESCTVCGDIIGTRHFTTLAASPSAGLSLTPLTGANSGTYSVRGSGATGAVVIPGWVHETDGTVRQITTIENLAFYWEDGWGDDNRYITSVIIHEGVTVIGNNAFTSDYNSIASITLPSSLTTIGNGALACPNLTSITIPANVISIGDDAFRGCSKLNITVHNDNPNYTSEGGILYNKDKTTLIAGSGAAGNITIPNSVTTIGRTAFMNSGITGINFSNVTSIGYQAFFGCSGLTSLTIPGSVTTIGQEAFRFCSNLESVVIEGNGVNFDLYGVFNNCAKLTSVTLGQDASFNDLTFPEGASLYAAYTIGGAGTYTREPGGEVWTAQSVPFCTHNYEWETTTPLTNGIGVETESCTVCGNVRGTRHFTTLASPPPGLVLTPSGGTYSVSDGKSATGAVVIPGWVHETDGTVRQLTTIENWAFVVEEVNTNITSVIIHEGVTVIGDFAFGESEGFGEKRALVSVTLPSSLTTIGGAAFSFCTNLTSITIPANVTSIGIDAFGGCSKLNITVDNDNPNYASEGGVLYDKDKTTLIAWPGASGNITIPNSVTRINHSAFKYAGITGINFSNVTYIDNNAFQRCNDLTSLTIPSSVTYIGQAAFSRCSNLESVTIEGNGITFGYGVFNNCGKLTSVTLGEDDITFAADVFPGGVSLLTAYGTGDAGTYTRDPVGDVWTGPATYTVTFNANIEGYDGTMDAQTHKVGQSQNLTSNAFTREGFTFRGWSAVETPINGTANYTNNQSVSNLSTTAGANVTLYAVWDFALEIGDEGPGEGIIFYIADGQDGRSLGFTVEGYGTSGVGFGFTGYTAYYLEAAPEDSGTARWGDIFDEINGREIGTGRKNTMSLLTLLEDDDPEPNRPARIAAAETSGGKNDWFLPSFDEMSQLVNQISLIDGIKSELYFSSSIISSNFVSLYNFGRDYWHEEFSRNTQYYIRAIRAF